MARRYLPALQVAALSITLLLIGASVASAQSPDAGQPGAGPTNSALLSPAAFARLAKPALASTAPPLAAAEAPPDAGQLRRSIRNIGRDAPAPKSPPRRKNTHKENMVALAVVSGIVGFLLIGALLHSGD